MTEPEDREHGAPEGAQCAEHPERRAYFTCPRCGGYACVACFHPSVIRCAQCLRHDPTEAAPPIPWERDDLRRPMRYLKTLASAFSPLRTAPAFAHLETRSPLRFLLASALPFALLAGVVPHTRTLFFQGDLAVRIEGHASELEIALDVLRAALVQLVISSVHFASLLLPFASLVRAYAPPERRIAPFRMLAYRYWLSPAGLLWVTLAAVVLPAPDQALGPAASAAWFVVGISQLAAEVLLILSMSATARLACGLGPLLSTVVVGVPLILSLVVRALTSFGLGILLPAAPGPPS